MKIKILSSASQDLMNGFRFYEKQSDGIGIYFLDSIFSDIDSLSRFTIVLKTRLCLFTLYLIAAEILPGPENN